MKFSGMTADEVERATNRDTFMTPEEAMQVRRPRPWLRGRWARGETSRGPCLPPRPGPAEPGVLVTLCLQPHARSPPATMPRGTGGPDRRRHPRRRRQRLDHAAGRGAVPGGHGLCGPPHRRRPQDRPLVLSARKGLGLVGKPLQAAPPSLQTRLAPACCTAVPGLCGRGCFLATARRLHRPCTR